jgi:formylglycine-generating enzyme required for sulfatase activity
LKGIQEWTNKHPDLLSPLAVEFVKASQNVKRQERFRLAALAGVGVTLLLLAFLGVTGQLDRFIYRPVDMEDYWVTIPAGEFQMGEVGVAEPVHTVYLDEYQIGKYEVTNRQYIQCVKAGSCDPPLNLHYTLEEYARHPVTSVNWDHATDYCAWVGGRLPTEAEWEKVASWDDQAKTKSIYPWGATIDCSFANYRGKDNGHDHCIGDITPVGSYESGKSPYGLYDMAGNAFEWVNDWYDETYYQNTPSSNPSGPESGQSRVLRGGTWDNGDFFVRSASRSESDPTIASYVAGIRCARSP